MTKRVIAGLLWFYVTWYAWSFIADAFGVSMLIGPVVGFMVAALIVGDPFGRVWSTNRARRAAPDLATAVGEPG